MNTATRLAGYVIGLMALFGVATGVGRAVGPVDSLIGSTADSSPQHHAGSADFTAHGDDRPGTEPQRAELPGGLMIADQGYRLSLTRTQLRAGPSTPVSFHILGPDGEPVTDYAVLHDKQLHLIAVRRDLSGFAHVHPELGATGRWTAPIRLSPGSWRLFADFAPAELGDNLILGGDVSVSGTYRPHALPSPADSAHVDGYTVTVAGSLSPGEESELTFTVTRAGEPVTDLQPYLAAYGHLVALRAGDLAYLHVHPADEAANDTSAGGPAVTFAATAPSAGSYRLFLDFKHDGVVRTAALTVRAWSA
jgi:hypothetical protein